MPVYNVHMRTTRSHAPIIAAVLLLLPVLYVGSYLAMVVPGGITERASTSYEMQGKVILYHSQTHYRAGEGVATWAERIYWPLERMDRNLRPSAWQDNYFDEVQN
jgi:hypothetical protein